VVKEVRYIDFEKVKETLENESFYSENSLPNSMRLKDYGFPISFLTISKKQELDFNNIIEKFPTDVFMFEYKSEIYMYIPPTSKDSKEIIIKNSEIYKYDQLIGTKVREDFNKKYMMLENRYKNLEELTK